MAKRDQTLQTRYLFPCFVAPLQGMLVIRPVVQRAAYSSTRLIRTRTAFLDLSAPQFSMLRLP